MPGHESSRGGGAAGGASSQLKWALAGALLGRAATKYDNRLSLRTNLVSWVVNLLELIPNRVVESEEEANKMVAWGRNNWRFAETLARTLGFQPVGAVSWTTCTARDGAVMRCLMVRPTVDAPRGAKLPVVLFVHGGGFTFGTLGVYEDFARKICAGTGAVVVAVDYRLAPEHKFPGPVHDVQDAALWLYGNPKEVLEFGGDPQGKGLAVCGDSAGGNLSTVVAVTLKDRVPFRLQGLIYPTTTFVTDLPAWSTMGQYTENGAVLSCTGMALARSAYLRDMALDPFNPLASPILFKDEQLRGAAPTFMITASADPLCTEGLAYKKRLASVGVPVEHVHYEREVHGFMSLDLFEHHHEGFQALNQALRGALFTDSRSGKTNSRPPAPLALSTGVAARM